MKLVLSALGLLVSLATVGIACGPKEKFCYKEGLPCSVIEGMDHPQDDSSDAGEVGNPCFDNLGNEIPCH